MRSWSSFKLALVVFLVAMGADLQAQPQRTFVSAENGIDTNPCSRPDPCRNFAAAIDAAAPGGEVYVLDSGGYGVVVITKAISLQARGLSAGISALGGTAVDVNAGPADFVNLQGLSINGLSLTGQIGIRYRGGAALHVHDSSIDGFQIAAIRMDTSGTLLVSDSTIRDNMGNYGMWIDTPTGLAQATIEGCRFFNNNTGVFASENSRVVVRDSVAAGHFSSGFRASTSGQGSAEMTIASSAAANNSRGITAGGGAGPGAQIVRISNVVVSANTTTGLYNAGNGSIISFGNNSVSGNTIDGTPTSTIPRI